MLLVVFFFKQKTAYEMRISDWSSDVCSSDLCNRFGVDENATIVGLVARLHPMKQPEVLVEAVRRARAKGRDMHLLIMGNGADDPRSDLTRTLHASLPADRFTPIGHQENVAPWMPAIDIFALRSEESRVGKECVSTCRSRLAPFL